MKIKTAEEHMAKNQLGLHLPNGLHKTGISLEQHELLPATMSSSGDAPFSHLKESDD